MALRLSTPSRNAATAAVVALLDADAGPGTIQIRSGTAPSSANDSATGTLLAEFTLNDPAFGSPTAGTADLDVSPAVTTTGLAAGTATWFRALDDSGDVAFDGDVTATGGGGELEVNTTTVSVGLDLEVTSFSYTQPAG
jgi:hypothetical protein